MKMMKTDNKLIMPNDTITGTIPPEFFAKYSGIEVLQMMMRGEIPAPPISKLLNMILSEVEMGKAVFRGIPLFDHYNPAGTVHGGWTAAILDSALGCAIHTMIPKGMAYTTIEFKVNLVRPLFDHSGEVVCEGNVLHFGRTIATSEATLKLANGKLVAHATCTCALMKLPD